MDSKALTKIQSIILIAVIVVAVVGGGVAYMLWNETPGSTEDIRIGVSSDLDGPYGKGVWQAVLLAAEQVNAEGGILGMNLTVVAEDDDGDTADPVVATAALTKLVTVDEADFVISDQLTLARVYQDICADHQKIYFSVGSSADEDAQRVVDHYEKYKYFFRVWSPNSTSGIDGEFDSLRTLKEYTGFNKVAVLVEDLPTLKDLAAGTNELLVDYGFEVVYDRTFPPMTTDFTSYFAAIESSGAQILHPVVITPSCYSLVKEYYNRQSPLVMWGLIFLAQTNDFWELTDGKCEYVSSVGVPVTSGYPLTNKTVLTREAYMQRWGEVPDACATAAYDVVRFILPDAIERAGTTETQALIKALEKTDVETSMARRFVFTSSHDVMIGLAGPNKPSQDYMLVCLFQFQANGTQVPVYPKEIMEEAGATYKYPPWRGPWEDNQVP